MLWCTTILLLLMASFMGCGKSEKEVCEEEYQKFIKKREKIVYGFEMNDLKKALKLYPEYKAKGLAGGLPDIVKFRQYSQKDTLNTLEYLPLFQMIAEIEESVKTTSGNANIQEKYDVRAIIIVKEELGLR